MAHSQKHLTISDDGMATEWAGRVWLNPPYGRETFRWLDRLSGHAGGGIALIFARTETIGFHEQIWNKAHAVFFFKGRIKFCYVDGTQANTANAPSCLVSYSEFDTASISRAMETGKLIGKLVHIERTET